MKITSAYTPHGSCTFSGQKVPSDPPVADFAQSGPVLIAANVSTGGTLTATASVSAQGELVLTDNDRASPRGAPHARPKTPPDDDAAGHHTAREDHQEHPGAAVDDRLVPLGSGKFTAARRSP